MTEKNRGKSQPDAKAKLPLRPLLAFAALLVAAAAIQVLREPVSEFVNRPIQRVAVEGSFRHMDKARVSQAVEPMLDGGFLGLSLPAVKEALEAEPWVARAALSRRWPDRLHIRIQEEQPIARWGDEGFVNAQGRVVRATLDEKLRSLPRLSGPEGQAKALMQHYQQLSRLLRPQGLAIEALGSDALGSWTLVLEGGRQVELGRDHTLERVKRFLLAYDRVLAERWDDVAAVDLRYGSGLAVQWREASVAAKDKQNNADAAMAASAQAERG